MRFVRTESSNGYCWAAASFQGATSATQSIARIGKQRRARIAVVRRVEKGGSGVALVSSATQLLFSTDKWAGQSAAAPGPSSSSSRMRHRLLLIASALSAAATTLHAAPLTALVTPPRATAPTRFVVSFSAAAHAAPVTGRLIVVVSKTAEPEPRLLVSPQGPAVFGVDLDQLRPAQTAVVDNNAVGYPTHARRASGGRLLRAGSDRRVHAGPSRRRTHDLGAPQRRPHRGLPDGRGQSLQRRTACAHRRMAAR